MKQNICKKETLQQKIRKSSWTKPHLSEVRPLRPPKVRKR